ncbi:C40 family peptidase [Gordonibacter urolithinfaciens]|uniref:Hydrolase Nlp/P60 n=1 Tax=Gordonibacter urolithinfaciens TaxID=1335613 RepID=A0A6N8IEW5_9ACTN|nr:C40 family peptidase [Gordonibacter urolithinfaciens]MVM54737.1 hydrolase Nlp/P60 [Gordonibacter urolithinfaciens]MVN14365.1 hydrolase Nlp/P60 [Gordonibacter urolithinfaciens]MVN38719.1 hydrolase Nlp/P60 [Gordonibacter urolithinfaciens]MVN56516.1 hydrolase Nlp/P60 [Gordonibacter urolithinfaciens]MVN60780.1 hydrolase Nlp/P60 [Gordonibacter urolithinfaciens]
MREHTNGLSRRAFIGGAVMLGAASIVAPTTAFAATAAEKQAEADAVRNQLVGLQADLEAAADSYKQALDAQEVAQAAMEAEQVKIDEANGKIADLQDKLGTRARSMYRSGSSSFLDFVMGATSFEEFTQNWDLLNKMNENDGQMVDETKTLREELQASKDEYARQEKIAADKAAEAKVIQTEAEAKVAQATELVNSLDAEAQALLAEEQAAAARAAAEQAAAEEAARQAQQSPSNGGGSGSGAGSGGGGSSYVPPVYNNGGGGGGGSVGNYGSVVDYAMSRIGCPYVWAAEGPDAFDCSGLVRWAYLQVGISLPHYTESLYACAKNRVPVSEARPGDVLYRPGHVGIAVSYGGSHYVHAPTFNAYVRDTDPLSWSGFTCALQF